MPDTPRYTAFAGQRLLCSGDSREVGIAVRRTLDGDVAETILIFDDRTGRQVDVDSRGTGEEIAARLGGSGEPAQNDARRSPGRPRLGVVAREVTLLPRHWDWLSRQSGGASAALRRLVDTARKLDDRRLLSREAQQASDRFMMAMLGNQPGYEEAARALYAGDHARFLAVSDPWPHDLRDHARRLAEPAFGDRAAAAEGDPLASG